MSLEYAMLEEQWTSPEEMPLRDYLRDMAGRSVSTSLYISYSNEDVDEDAHVVELADSLTGDLRELYEFRGDRVADYLEKHPSLSGVLKEAHGRVRKYFGPDTHAVLDLVVGAEAEEDERLFLFIQTSLSADEALDSLDELYEHWWLDALRASRPKFSIDVEYE